MTRGTDMLARVGGDEFAFVGPGPVDEKEANRTAAGPAARAAELTAGVYSLRDTGLTYSGVSAGVVAVRFLSVDQALGQADAAMYLAKRVRQQRNSDSAGAGPTVR